MIRIWIKQVLIFISNIFWIEEIQNEEWPLPLYKFKYKWVISLFEYKNIIVKNNIWKLKFRSDKKIAKLFGQKISDTINKYGFTDYTLVPVPIHWKRKFERGFNQTELICEEILHAHKIRYGINLKYEKILKRIYYSKKQSWNNRKERFKNTSNAFKLKNRYRNYILGRKFLLIDDVITTGSTLKETRREILIHGAISVRAITVAC